MEEHLAPAEEIKKKLIVGLGQTANKFIPSEFCYNDVGSRLFQDLCNEPDYYLSRLERAILARHRNEILLLLSGRDVLEFGAGDCSKLCELNRHNKSVEFKYFPNDINLNVLKSGAENYASLEYNNSVTPIYGDYYEALSKFSSSISSKKAVLFLGSTIGNFSEDQREKLFEKVGSALRSGDLFVVACDLFKSVATMNKAYNGSGRIVKSIELNSLRYLNQLYDGNFDTERFSHFCDFNPQTMYLESRLYSMVDQTVSLKKLHFEFGLKAGQSVLMDKMWKPTLEQISSSFSKPRWRVLKSFLDDKLPYALIVGEVEGG